MSIYLDKLANVQAVIFRMHVSWFFVEKLCVSDYFSNVEWNIRIYVQQ